MKSISSLIHTYFNITMITGSKIFCCLFCKDFMFFSGLSYAAVLICYQRNHRVSVACYFPLHKYIYCQCTDFRGGDLGLLAYCLEKT